MNACGSLRGNFRSLERVLGNLVWMDLEMTGLNPLTERIIEIATIVTDDQLNLVEEGPVMAIRQSEELLAAMDDWNQTHHRDSGLLDRVRKEGVLEAEAEAVTLDFLSRHVAPNESPLCGNTIWQDRRFLVRYMPVLEAHMHYRNIDVSSIKELARRWRPALLDGFSKKNEHTAMADIRESIAELEFYRDHFIRLD